MQPSSVASSMMAVNEQIMQPIIAAATGIRTQLETEGWSPTAAESVALAFIQKCLAR